MGTTGLKPAVRRKFIDIPADIFRMWSKRIVLCSYAHAVDDAVRFEYLFSRGMAYIIKLYRI